MMPLPHRDAWCLAIDSGVTENHPSSSIFTPLSNLEKSKYLWHQYLPISEEYSPITPSHRSSALFNKVLTIFRSTRNYYWQ